MDRDDALILTVEEAARRLKVGKGTVYDMVRQGTIPHIRLGAQGRIIRIPAWGLEQWIARQAGLAQPPQPTLSLPPRQRH